MKKLFFFIPVIIIAACSQTETEKAAFNYPVTKKTTHEDTYFGTIVADPYKWLENDTSAETAEWVTAQNKVTFDYLASIPFRDKIRERLTKIWDYPKISAPYKRSGYYLYFKNDGLQDQSVLYFKEDLDGAEKVLLDPNTLSEDGTVSLRNSSVSKDGKYFAYSLATAGSDWSEIFVKDMETGEQLEDHINWIKFSGLSWYKDGFYYSCYDQPEEGKELSNINQFHKVYYHKIGTDQSEDVLFYENPEYPKRNYTASVTEDEKVLVMYETESTHGSAVYIKDLTDPDSELIQITEGFEYEYGVLDHIDGHLMVRTNFEAPKYKLISIDINNPGKENWQDIIPEKDNVLRYCVLSNGQIVASYLKDACSRLEVYDLKGGFLKNIDLPGIGSVAEFSGRKDEKIAFYTFTSFTTPGNIYKLDMNSYESSLYMSPEIDFDGSIYETKQVFYKSKDGTKIPMFIIHQKNIKLDGSNPVLLYGYGGFNISLTPSFSISNLIWLENGGVYALANLRGGGEYGEEWHQAGTKLNKQNVFDDFISAAEYLIREKYTSPKMIAIRGASNGGLLVGAVTNQRPDLFGVALPAVGVMDMLRFHKFTIGWAWTGDYGSSDDSVQFEYLYKYSPLHNISEDVEYPAVMVTTADHDDRVVPAHSFKYIATLQEKYKGKNPVMIRIETKAGHGGGKPTSKVIDESTDIWAFTFKNLGITPGY